MLDGGLCIIVVFTELFQCMLFAAGVCGLCGIRVVVGFSR